MLAFGFFSLLLDAPGANEILNVFEKVSFGRLFPIIIVFGAFVTHGLSHVFFTTFARGRATEGQLSKKEVVCWGVDVHSLQLSLVVPGVGDLVVKLDAVGRLRSIPFLVIQTSHPQRVRMKRVMVAPMSR